MGDVLNRSVCVGRTDRAIWRSCLDFAKDPSRHHRKSNVPDNREIRRANQSADILSHIQNSHHVFWLIRSLSALPLEAIVNTSFTAPPSARPFSWAQSL